MGEPKCRPDAPRVGARYRAGALEDPQPIARRFAYPAGMRQAAKLPADAVRGLRPPATARGTTAGGKPPRSPALLAAWFFAPLAFLCLILAGLWLGSDRDIEPAQASPKPQVQLAAIFTAPETIEAVAGRSVSFPIALDGTVPPRSVVAIGGLPQGSNFSQGRPFGEDEWNLKPDQIGDLELVLPAAASGEYRLSIMLVAPDDAVIARADSLLLATRAAPPAPFEQVAVESAAAAGDGKSETLVLNPVLDGTLASIPATVPGGAMTRPTSADGAESDSTPSLAAAEQAGEVTAPTTVPPGRQPVPSALGPSTGEAGLGTVQPSIFVNMRARPSSSSPVLGVIAKGAELPVLDRKRGWVEVAHPESGKQGWIYSGLLVGETKPSRRVSRVAPAEPEDNSDSFWGRVGRWLSPTPETPKQN